MCEQSYDRNWVDKLNYMKLKFLFNPSILIVFLNYFWMFSLCCEEYEDSS